VDSGFSRESRANIESIALARIPEKWNRFADKHSRQINMFEQILFAKVFYFGEMPANEFGSIRSKLIVI
jgi:hypothetical protein